MALTLDLNNMFLEDLNPSQIYPITSKVRFVKRLANYVGYVPNNLPLRQPMTKPQQNKQS